MAIDLNITGNYLQNGVPIGGLPTMLEYNEGDKTLWNNGKNNIVTNTSFGDGALRLASSGGANTAIGNSDLKNLTTANYCTSLGYLSGQGITTGSYNTMIGSQAGTYTTTGLYNTIIGANAKCLNSGAVYPTVIGYNGFGNNYSTIVGASGTDTYGGSVVLGYNAATTGANQFVVGSSSQNAGSVTTESNSSSKVWNVKINGVDQKILLA